VIPLTAAFAFPVGVLGAVYLEEYAPRNWWTRILRVNIANLAGVPSVVYGLLGSASSSSSSASAAASSPAPSPSAS
jgi:phosphate transport system permease protein